MYRVIPVCLLILMKECVCVRLILRAPLTASYHKRKIPCIHGTTQVFTYYLKMCIADNI